MAGTSVTFIMGGLGRAEAAWGMRAMRGINDRLSHRAHDTLDGNASLSVPPKPVREAGRLCSPASALCCRSRRLARPLR